MSRISLQPNGNLTSCGPLLLRTLGFAGTVSRRAVLAGGMRDDGALHPIVAGAMARNHVIIQDSVQLEESREIAGFGGEVPRTRHNEPAIELHAPAPPAGWGQFVMTTDESGVVTWDFTESPTSPAEIALRGTDRLNVYRIRRTVPPSSSRPAEATRGWIGIVGKKVIEVLIFPLIDPVLGDIGGMAVGVWERMFRPYCIRTFAPANYRMSETTPLQEADWQQLGSGRSLLFVHGTFSRAHSAFHGLSAECMAELYRRYEGRVFAFDHYTMSHDPRQNVDWLLKQLPDKSRLQLDIVCHSRGGLVSRTLAEKASEFSLGSGTLEVDRIIHVGAPNMGTPLTDTPHLNDLIESYTNIFNVLPDTASSLMLDGLFLLGKQMAAKTVDGLDGLFSMLPSGPFLREWLNAGTASSRYFAIASNYRPTHPGLLSWATDRLFQGVFHGAENDLVVPTASVYEQNGSSLFPISNERRLVFQPADAVTHIGYFRHPRTHDAILRWLSADSRTG